MGIQRTILGGLGSLLLMGTLAFAQIAGTTQAQPSAAGGPSGKKQSTADRSFIDKAAQGGMAEVEPGQLAQQNAQSQEVKDFGKHMVDDHSKANDQLKQLASQQGVTLPTEISAKDMATKNRLSQLHGDAFDKAYMKRHGERSPQGRGRVQERIDFRQGSAGEGLGFPNVAHAGKSPEDGRTG